jgi:LmbE family N-acetylglucosaminyl deacetylase
MAEESATESKEFIPRIAMSIHAHPDDQEFSVAGTLARWAQAGCEVISLILTSGDGGSNDVNHDASYKPTLAGIREAEQSAANQVIGVRHTIYLRLPDGELEPTVALRKEVTKIIRAYKPEAVVTGDPQAVFSGNGYINHPDHRAAAQLATYAVFPSAGSRLVFADLLAEGFEPHNVKRLYLHGPEKPDTWVDISSSIDQKVAALKKHVSQLGDWDPEKMIREWAAEEGKEKDLPFAEAYKVMILQQDDGHD